MHARKLETWKPVAFDCERQRGCDTPSELGPSLEERIEVVGLPVWPGARVCRLCSDDHEGRANVNSPHSVLQHVVISTLTARSSTLAIFTTLYFNIGLRSVVHWILSLLDDRSRRQFAEVGGDSKLVKCVDLFWGFVWKWQLSQACRHC